MGCFERESPALKEILLKLYRAEKPVEIDHHLYEFGSVEYHVQSSAADPRHNYLSISTPLLSQGTTQSPKLSTYTVQMVKNVCSDAIEIVEPSREGYQLTLRLLFAKLSQGKDSEKVIKRISSVQAVILSSQLKEMLMNVNSKDTRLGMYKPIKLVYLPREPFYAIRQPQKITAVFPMRFKDHSDVVIATAFFQELMDLGSSEKWAKVPPCAWSPIPPPELRGESLEDLSTNGGFVSFDIFSRHVGHKKLEKTVWTLLNFYAFVKNHVKCTRGFIQRRMQKRLENLVKVVLHKANIQEDEVTQQLKGMAISKWTRPQQKRKGCMNVGKMVSMKRPKIIKQRWGSFMRKIKQIRFRIKIRGFGRFRRRWLKLPKFSSSMGYSKLE